MRLSILWLAVLPLSAAVVPEVRYKISAGDLMSADAIADEFCRMNGSNSECAAAVSWLARGAVYLGDYEAAERFVAKTRTINDELLRKGGSVESDAFLRTAVGGRIEAESRLLAAQGHRDRAIALLRSELPKWPLYALQARIQKNLNVLTLEGKPAPHLDASERGKVVVLFLWGPWCGDCTAQAPALARIHKRYPSVVIRAVTRRIGEAGQKHNAAPVEEDAERERVWKESYLGLEDVTHPVDEAAMLDYGVSSTPTFVLIDGKGLVRLYKPYRMSEEELARQIERILR